MSTNLDLMKTLSITYSLNRIRVSTVKAHLTHILLKKLASPYSVFQHAHVINHEWNWESYQFEYIA